MPPKFKSLGGQACSFDKADAYVDVRKYRVGERSQAYENFKQHSPTFAFDFISLQQSDFCFDGGALGRKDYVSLLKGLKRISSETYGSMSDNHQFHFHSIDWDDVSVSESEFLKCVGAQSGDITAYQFKVFQEARVIGFIYKGIFYLVMYDRRHNAYKRK